MFLWRVGALWTAAGILASSLLLSAPTAEGTPAAVPETRSCFATVASDRPLVAGGEAMLTFRIEALGSGLAAGDTLDLHPPLCAPYRRMRWSAFQLDDADREGWTVVTGDVSATLVKHPRDPLCRDKPVGAIQYLPEILRLVLEKPLYSGGGIDVTYGNPGPNQAGLARVQFFPEDAAPFLVYLRRASGNERMAVPWRSAPLAVARAAPKRIYLSGPSDVSAQGGASFQVAALDRWGFPAAPFPEGVEVKALHESGRRWGPLPIVASARDPAVWEIREVMFPQSGIWWLSACAPDSESWWELPVLVGPVSGQRLYWGDLHWQSNQSDGSRPPRDGFLYARDIVGLDFTAKTDHDSHTIFSCMDEADWEETVRLAEEFNEPGRFATLLGWEYTYGAGHQNVYFRTDGPYEPVTVRSSPEELWAVLTPGEVITVPHHPAGGINVPYMHWEHRDPRFIKTVEVFSLHGNGEMPLAPQGPRSRGETREKRRPRRGSVQEAMSLGLELSVVASTDNHTSTPANPVQHSRLDLSVGSGLCGVWLDELRREHIYDAIVSGHTYGTTGPRIRIEFCHRSEGEDVRGVEGLVIGAADLAAVELIGVKDGLDPPFPVLASFEFAERICSFIWEPDADADGVRAVYLRVTQTDEEMAWSSPLSLSGGGSERVRY